MMEAIAEDARVLAINIARIGDTLLTTPLLRALKQAVPRGELTCIAHPKRIEVLQGLPFIDRLLPMTKRSAFWRARLAARRYDLVVALGRDPVMLRYGLRAGRRVAAFRQGDAAIDAALAWRVEPPAALIHAVDERQLLLDALGLPAAGRRLAYAVADDEAAWAAGWLRAQGIEGRRLIGIQAASFPTKPYRDWPETHFRELARRIVAARPDAQLLLLGDTADAPRAARIAEGIERAQVAAGRFTLRQSAAIMQRLSLYVGVDTGPTHLAGALGIPMVALYHCKHPGRFLAPLDHPAFLAVVEHPRSDGDCNEAHGMAEIAVDAVWEQVREGLH